MRYNSIVWFFQGGKGTKGITFKCCESPRCPRPSELNIFIIPDPNHEESFIKLPIKD